MVPFVVPCHTAPQGPNLTFPLSLRCLDALVTMGVLIPGNDMTAVRRTAQFFLTNFRERLAQQRAEAAANPQYGDTFKGELSKEEKQAKRKQILSSIGALWLFCAVWCSMRELRRALAAHRCSPSVMPAPEQWYVMLQQERICFWHQLIRCAARSSVSSSKPAIKHIHGSACRLFGLTFPCCSCSRSGSQRHLRSW